MPQSTNSKEKSGQEMGFNDMVRAAGFTSFNQFLLSYNLRVYNDEDVQEGKAILQALFDKK
ncbi:hypothetical protein LTR47_006678 [Exophiala xenobiotica]|nr:hypothetical protein LTR47_006678 [Exophiala xenobiotica]KAK5244554.1 hypothetical protein LTS06_009889 [Exophiala xenobiotica]KAK5347407.1 hypothetical protein LTR61_008994 [Exophiala xenobiotica]KAK5363663.1 hypothetical protein LTR11_009091 [Exophiala xenobiotica]KAK5365028.1 hypothetical protein LTS03_009088 [Exophiala xenobiotica]